MFIGHWKENDNPCEWAYAKTFLKSVDERKMPNVFHSSRIANVVPQRLFAIIHKDPLGVLLIVAKITRARRRVPPTYRDLAVIRLVSHTTMTIRTLSILGSIHTRCIGAESMSPIVSFDTAKAF